MLKGPYRVISETIVADERQRHGIYRMLRLKVVVCADGRVEVTGVFGGPLEAGPTRSVETGVMSSQSLPTKAISLVPVSRNARDVHVYRHGRYSVTISAAGGLEALEFVQSFVEATLYGGLASRELRGYTRLHVVGNFLG